MNTFIALIVLITAAAAAFGLTALIRRDRPATPPADQVDWRSEGLAWRQLGIN